MSPRKRRYLKNTILTLALLAVTAWVVPFFFNAGRYRPVLKAGLERSLHRKVTLGHISLHFFPHLGFTVDDVVVGEDPAFGLEPFIRVDNIDCNLLWRSLWHSHLYFGTLNLNAPSINIVRNSDGKWNIENLLLQSKVTRQPSGGASASAADLSIEIKNARLNFKVGENKKPFAIVSTNAHLDFDYSAERFNFRIAGEPVRTDLEFPTPGLVALDGVWSPAAASGHTLNATLRMQGGMLYDWIPLLTGQNPEIYGVANSTVHLSGTLRKLKFSGDSLVTQVHRWEQLPSSYHLPCAIRFRGQFDRDNMSLLISGMDLGFADSQIHLEGTIAKVTSHPDFDLVLAFERSQMQDLMRLGSRVFWGSTGWGLKGRLNGMISVRGPWGNQHYGGFLNAHKVLLDTSSGTYPVSDLAIRIEQTGVRLSPARVRLAPGVEVVAEGTVRQMSPRRRRRRSVPHPTYDLTLHSSAVNLGRLVHFGRALGFLGNNHMEAQGIGSFTLHLAGRAWPWTRPTVTAHANVRSARLVIPGLSEPLNIPRARVQVYGQEIIVNPIVAVMGTSVFSGWIMHQRESQSPWDFSLKADKLSVEQVAQWFNGFSDHNSSSFFERLSSIGSLITRRQPSFHMAGRLNVRGKFSTRLLAYRALALRDFKVNLRMHNRKIRLTKVSFEAGGGHGEGNALVDLSRALAEISGDAAITGARVQTLRQYLPPALSGIHGDYSAEGKFEARGLTHAEIVRTLQGSATLRVASVDLGNFDPVRMLGRRLGIDVFEKRSQQQFIAAATAHLHIQDRTVTLDDCPVEFPGAAFRLNGTYSFDGAAKLQVQADLGALQGGTMPVPQRSTTPASRLADLRLAGTLRDLAIVPTSQISQSQP